MSLRQNRGRNFFGDHDHRDVRIGANQVRHDRGIGDTQPFDSEVVWNYEAGVKFDGLEHRLQANVSAFTDRYKQLQIIQNVTSPSGFFTATNNAGAAQPAEARWNPAGYLRNVIETTRVTVA